MSAVADGGNRERGREPGIGLVDRRVADEDRRTPEEQTRVAVNYCRRNVESLDSFVADLQRADPASEPQAWSETKASAEHQLKSAQQALVDARERAGASDELTALETQIAQHRKTMSKLEPPRGWARVAREEEILAVLQAPVTGSLKSGYEDKERLLVAELVQLSASDRKQLLRRLRKADKEDKIASAVAGLIEPRRTHIAKILSSSQHAAAVAPQKASASSPDPQGLPAAIRGDLEAATGRSLDHVRVHADAHGADVATAHDARAVAVGSDIFMGEGQLDATSGPGRELLAHEVAHVGQAEVRGGTVAPAAKREQASTDAAEVEADTFAARFRADGAAARWTPSVAVSASAPMRAPAAGAARAQPTSDVAYAYLRANEDKFLAAIEARLRTFPPPPNERLVWVADGIATAFRSALAAVIAGAPLWDSKLAELVHPADPWRSIDANRTLSEGTPGVVVDGREPKGPLDWSIHAGEAIATDVQQALVTSLARMVPRYLAQHDVKRPPTVVVADLVTSHPMDRVTAVLLCNPAVVSVKTEAKGHGAKHQPSDPKNFPDGVRFLQDYYWLGGVDPKLWNWVEVRDPHATAEDLAATLWLDPAASANAYGITGSGPYFRVDPVWARKFSPYAKNAPDKPERDDDNVLDLAGSSLATDAAIAQAADAQHDKLGHALPPDVAALTRTLERSGRQLARAKELLATTKLWTLVAPALAWVAKESAAITATSTGRLSALTPVIEGQSEILFEAVGALADVMPLAGTHAMVNNTSPVLDVVRVYAVTIGESHLIESARTQLGLARRAKTDLPLALLEMSARDTAGAARDLEASGHVAHGDDYAQLTDIDQRRIHDMRAKRAAGREIDAGAATYVAARIRERAVEVRAKQLYGELMDLGNLARDSSFGFFEHLASEFDSSVGSLPGLIFNVVADLDATVLQPHAKARDAELAGAATEAAKADVLDRAASHTETTLETFIAKHKLKTRMSVAMGIIERQERRAAVIRVVTQLVILVGVSVVGGIAGNAVAGAVRGAMLADAAESSMGLLWATRAAKATGAVMGLATDAGINATAQLATSGGHPADAFLDNFLASGAMRLALAPIHRIADAYGAAAKDLEHAALWERSVGRGKAVLRAGAVLTADMITAAAVDYVVHRVRYGEKPDEKVAMEWALQGASMAIGNFVGKWVHGFDARVSHLAQESAQLRRRAARMRIVSQQVEQTGDKDAAMELVIERHQALEDEAAAIQKLQGSGKLDARTAGELEAGNRAEQGDVHDKAFATMPLRLNGLAPDDASGKVWAGTTEDIAVALDQAHRAGLHVEVLAHDTQARQWKILYDGAELTIVETALQGRPRAAKTTPSDADRSHAQRYARAAAFMQERWEARTKAEIDGRKVIEFDHLQLGGAYAGVVSQSTMPARGEGMSNKVIVYDHTGTLSNRGPQELGQPPEKFDAPGVRTSEQAPEGAKWAQSDHLGDSLDVGRLETQTPAYRGSAVGLEARPKDLDQLPEGNKWEAPARRFRVRVRDGSSAERWFYVDRFDNVGGLGSMDMKQVARAVDPAQMAAMLEHGLLLRGDDPGFRAKMRPGRILVWGGTPTGAWAAEPAIHAPTDDVTIMGDTRPPGDWPVLLREYEEVMTEIGAHPGDQPPAELLARRTRLEKAITDAHRGAAIPRNRKPGATYGTPQAGQHATHVEFGTPSRIEPTPDGRVLVTVGTGEDARTSVYDQVVIAHGPDPAAAGAPGGLLGKGAEKLPTGGLGEVPTGTIALRPIWGPPHAGGGAHDLLGLESVDPPGIQLKGAAFASKKMAPWVEKSQRAEFERVVDQMAGEHAGTRDHGPISDDSRGVNPGVEVQRDRIPRANEILGAKTLRLAGPEHTLVLDPAHPETWDDRVRDFFAMNLRAEGKWINVKRLVGGASGDIVYHVSVDATEVGIFKLFKGRGAADEQEVLGLLAKAKLTHMTAVRERGRVDVSEEKLKGGLLMDAAKGESVASMIEALQTELGMRRQRLAKLDAAVAQVAVGLAEMHVHFEGQGKDHLMSEPAKRSDAGWFLNKNFGERGEDVARVRAALGDDFARVKGEIEGPLQAKFIAAEVPATAYHGDANAGNFILDNYDPNKKAFEALGVIDVSAMKWSVEKGADQKFHGTKTGAADIARFLGSLETLIPGKLAAGEIQALRASFLEAYYREYAKDHHSIDPSAMKDAEAWYRIELEIAVLKKDPSAKARILALLNLAATP